MIRLPENFKAFELTLMLEKPNENWSDALKALWYDAKGNWEASHNIAQDMHTEMGSWIHAYLHRKETDDFNARYWYRQARKTFPEITLEKEFKEMVLFVLNS